ncbi:MAG: rhodanese, partial [Tistrella sp.]|nr:rhodanese [Tistrella sp.]
MALKKTVKQMVAEATARIRTIPIDEAKTLLDDPDTLFVDIRDVRELE